MCVVGASPMLRFALSLTKGVLSLRCKACAGSVLYTVCLPWIDLTLDPPDLGKRAFIGLIVGSRLFWCGLAGFGPLHFTKGGDTQPKTP